MPKRRRATTRPQAKKPKQSRKGKKLQGLTKFEAADRTRKAWVTKRQRYNYQGFRSFPASEDNKARKAEAQARRARFYEDVIKEGKISGLWGKGTGVTELGEALPRDRSDMIDEAGKVLKKSDKVGSEPTSPIGAEAARAWNSLTPEKRARLLENYRNNIDLEERARQRALDNLTPEQKKGLEEGSGAYRTSLPVDPRAAFYPRFTGSDPRVETPSGKTKYDSLVPPVGGINIKALQQVDPNSTTFRDNMPVKTDGNRYQQTIKQVSKLENARIIEEKATGEIAKEESKGGSRERIQALRELKDKARTEKAQASARLKEMGVPQKAIDFHSKQLNSQVREDTPQNERQIKRKIKKKVEETFVIPDPAQNVLKLRTGETFISDQQAYARYQEASSKAAKARNEYERYLRRPPESKPSEKAKRALEEQNNIAKQEALNAARDILIREHLKGTGKKERVSKAKKAAKDSLEANLMKKMEQIDPEQAERLYEKVAQEARAEARKLKKEAISQNRPPIETISKKEREELTQAILATYTEKSPLKMAQAVDNVNTLLSRLSVKADTNYKNALIETEIKGAAELLNAELSMAQADMKSRRTEEVIQERLFKNAPDFRKGEFDPVSGEIKPLDMAEGVRQQYGLDKNLSRTKSSLENFGKRLKGETPSTGASYVQFKYVEEKHLKQLDKQMGVKPGETLLRDEKITKDGKTFVRATVDKWAVADPSKKSAMGDETFVTDIGRKPEFFAGARGQVRLSKDQYENKLRAAREGNLIVLLDKKLNPINVGQIDPETGKPSRDPTKKATLGLIPNKDYITSYRYDDAAGGDPTFVTERTGPLDSGRKIGERTVLLSQAQTRSVGLVGKNQVTGEITLGRRTDSKNVFDKKDDALIIRQEFIEQPGRTKPFSIEVTQSGEKPKRAYLIASESQVGTITPDRHRGRKPEEPVIPKSGSERAARQARLEQRSRNILKDTSEIPIDGKMYRVATKEEWDAAPENKRAVTNTPGKVIRTFVPPGTTELAPKELDTIKITTPTVEIRGRKVLDQQLAFANLDAEAQSTKLGKVARYGLIEPQKVRNKYDQEDILAVLGGPEGRQRIPRMPGDIGDTPGLMVEGPLQQGKSQSEIRAGAIARMQRDPQFKQRVFEAIQKEKGWDQQDIQAEFEDPRGFFGDVAAAVAAAGVYKARHRILSEVLPTRGNEAIGKALTKITGNPGTQEKWNVYIASAKEANQPYIAKFIEDTSFKVRRPLGSVGGLTLPGVRVNDFSYETTPGMIRSQLISGEKLFLGKLGEQYRGMETVTNETLRAANSINQGKITGALNRRTIESMKKYREGTDVYGVGTSIGQTAFEKLRGTLTEIAPPENTRALEVFQKAAEKGETSVNSVLKDRMQNELYDIIQDPRPRVGEVFTQREIETRGFLSRRAPRKELVTYLNTVAEDGSTKQVEISDPLAFVSKAKTMLGSLDTMKEQDAAAVRMLNLTSTEPKGFKPTMKRIGAGNFTANEKTFLVGAGVAAAAAGTAYGVHKFKQRQERKRGEAPKSLGNRYLPPAFNVYAPSVSVAKKGTFEDTAFNRAVNIAGVDKPKVSAKMEKKRLAFRPSDINPNLSVSAPLIGRPKIGFKKDPSDGKLRDALFIRVATPGDKKAVPKGYKVKVAGKTLPGVIEAETPFKPKRVRANRAPLMRKQEDKEKLVARYAGSSQEARVKGFYNADKSIQDLFNNSAEVKRVKNKYNVGTVANPITPRESKYFQNQINDLE